MYIKDFGLLFRLLFNLPGTKCLILFNNEKTCFHIRFVSLGGYEDKIKPLPVYMCSDFIWPFLPPFKGVIPNPKMVFIFPIVCIFGFFPKLFEHFCQL